jgi:hypothetical protein
MTARAMKETLPSPALPGGLVFLDDPTEFHDPSTIVVRLRPGIRSKEKLLAVFAEKLRFPKYFGWNWDAFEECLKDLSWLPADQGVAIVHRDLPFGAGGKNREIYLNILASALARSATTPARPLQIIWPAALRDEVSSTTNQPR